MTKKKAIGLTLSSMGGDVKMWIEQETIHLVAFDRPYQDPVELTAKTARELAAKLTEAADKIG